MLPHTLLDYGDGAESIPMDIDILSDDGEDISMDIPIISSSSPLLIGSDGNEIKAVVFSMTACASCLDEPVTTAFGQSLKLSSINSLTPLND